MVVLAALALGLGACATVAIPAPSVVRLSTTQYPPTQAVAVLNASPSTPYESIARLSIEDSSGAATQAQLEAKLVEAAKSLGADALVVGTLARTGGSDVGFNPSGGQLQNAGAAGAVSLTAVAIRYTH